MNVQNSIVSGQGIIIDYEEVKEYKIKRAKEVEVLRGEGKGIEILKS